MHKTFYASGFLYRPKSAQILLQQLVSKLPESSSWSIVSGKNNKDEERAENTFQRVIYDLLKVKININSIHPVYDYFHNVYNATHYVFYAEIDEEEIFWSPKETAFSWFTFKQIPKLLCNLQTRQDIIVAQRVINLQIRETQEKMFDPKEVNQ